MGSEMCIRDRYLTFLLGALVLEIGNVYGNEKACLLGLGINDSVSKYLKEKMTCAEKTGRYMLPYFILRSIDRSVY